MAGAKKEPKRKSAFARAARRAIVRHDGVARLCFRGLSVSRDRYGQLYVEERIVLHDGHNARQTGIDVQQTILAAIRDLSDRPVGYIHVTVANVALPKSKRNVQEP